jgi:hypothetical protein
LLLQEQILEILRTRKCKRVQDLVDEIQKIDKSVATEKIKDAIESLQDSGSIELLEPAHNESFIKYLTKYYYANFALWLSLAAISLTLASTYLLPQTVGGFWSLIQIVSGGIVVLFIPGYALAGLVFPKKEIASIERVGLGFALNFALVPILWLVMNYSQVGIGVDLIVSGMSISGMLLIFGNAYRKFLGARNQQVNND